MVQVKAHPLRDILTFLSPLKNLPLSGHSSYFSRQLIGKLKKGYEKVTLKNQAKGMPENFNVVIRLKSRDILACGRRSRKS